MSCIPEELLINIFTFTNNETKITLSEVSTTFRRISFSLIDFKDENLLNLICSEDNPKAFKLFEEKNKINFQTNEIYDKYLSSIINFIFDDNLIERKKICLYLLSMKYNYVIRKLQFFNYYYYIQHIIKDKELTLSFLNNACISFSSTTMFAIELMKNCSEELDNMLHHLISAKNKNGNIILFNKEYSLKEYQIIHILQNIGKKLKYSEIDYLYMNHIQFLNLFERKYYKKEIVLCICTNLNMDLFKLIPFSKKYISYIKTNKIILKHFLSQNILTDQEYMKLLNEKEFKSFIVESIIDKIKNKTLLLDYLFRKEFIKYSHTYISKIIGEAYFEKYDNENLISYSCYSNNIKIAEKYYNEIKNNEMKKLVKICKEHDSKEVFHIFMRNKQFSDCVLKML